MSPKRIVPLLVLTCLVGFLVWRYGIVPRRAGDGLLVSGTVEATEARLGFELPGRLVAVLPREGDRVEAGAPLARLDAAELAARHAQAAAQVEAARAQLAELEAGSRPEEIAAARAALAAAEERVADAERDGERARRLYDGRAIAREALDKAEAALEVARAQRTQAAEQAALVARGPRAERIAAARAALATADAALAALTDTLAKTELTAPFAGLVTVRHREPGEIVPAGGAVLTLMDPDDRWVRIYVPENHLGAVALGAAVEISADTFPGRRYPGEVAHVASEAEFTPKNVQTTEERVRLVYAVKVRITGDAALELKPGLPADVHLPSRPE